MVYKAENVSSLEFIDQVCHLWTSAGSAKFPSSYIFLQFLYLMSI